MSISKRAAGLAGAGLLALGSAAFAQEAAPAQPQAAAQGCSGLGCIFGGSRAAPPAQRPEEAQALQDASRAARADAAADAGPAQSSSSAAAGKTVAKRAAKPIHVVTIAADAAEATRLKGLAAAMPKEKIRIVTRAPEAGKPATDFTVATTLDASRGTETAKLFTEQMHIVAGESVHSVADLRGKVVSFGPENSPSQSAARKAFEALNVKVQETPLDVDNALDGLATGDVAAVVMLAPQPIARLKTVSAPGAHLVSWPQSASLPEGASATTIDAGAYPGLAKPGEAIRAMGVDATITVNAKAAGNGAAKTFLKALADHSAALSKRGFDLLKADLDARRGRRVASADRS